jgi:hypothetical protein
VDNVIWVFVIGSAVIAFLFYCLTHESDANALMGVVTLLVVIPLALVVGLIGYFSWGTTGVLVGLIAACIVGLLVTVVFMKVM